MPECQTIRDFSAARARDKGGGSGDNRNSVCKAPVKSLPPTYQHSFLQARCPSCCPTNIVEVKDKNAYEHIAHRKKDVELGPFVIQWAGGLLPLAVGYITYGRLPHIASELQVSAGMVWYSRV